MTEVYKGRTIAIGTTKVEIPFVPVKDMFRIADQIPIVCIGDTGCGKTTLALDILYHYANQAPYVYFVTQTEKNIFDNDLSRIPSFFIHDPRKDALGVLQRIWNDITSRVDAMTAMTDENKYLHILGILYPGVDFSSMLRELEGDAKIETATLIVETVTRLIIDKVKMKPEVLDDMLESDRRAINALISTTTKSILILDDVSGLLEACAKATGKTAGLDGVLAPRKEVFKQLLSDIVTRGRHYNCLVCMFVHSFDAIPDETIKKMTKMILLGGPALTTFRRMTRFGDNVRYAADIIEKSLKIFDKTLYSHYFVYIDRSSTPYGLKVGKADVHADNDPIRLNPETEAFHRLLSSCVSNQQIVREQPSEPDDGGDIDLDVGSDDDLI